MHLAGPIEVVVLTTYPVTPRESIAIRAKVVPFIPHSNPTVFSICPIGFFILVALTCLYETTFSFDYPLIDSLDNTLSIGFTKLLEIRITFHVHSVTFI